MGFGTLHGSILKSPCEMSAVVIPTLQGGWEQRPSEVERLTQGHTARRRPGWDPSTGIRRLSLLLTLVWAAWVGGRLRLLWAALSPAVSVVPRVALGDSHLFTYLCFPSPRFRGSGRLPGHVMSPASV